MTRLLTALLLGPFLTACATAQHAETETGDRRSVSIDDQWSTPEYRAFDFWLGEWDANWRGRKADTFYHVANGSWMRHQVFPVLGGKAVVELAWARDEPEEPSQRGFSIRYVDAASGRWIMAQNWPNARGTGSGFTDQLIGADYLGRRTMYSQAYAPNADGGFDSQHRRYNFTDIQADSFRWDGSNTIDRGDTWRTWMVVDFLRNEESALYEPDGDAWPGVHAESLCTEAPHGEWDHLQGAWIDPETGVSLMTGKLLDGCAMAFSLESDEERVLALIGYYDQFQHWVMYRLDDQQGSGHEYFVSKNAGAGAVFEHAQSLKIKNEYDPYLSSKAFKTDAALRRYVFEAVDDDRLVVAEEIRDDADAAWARGVRHEFVRQD